MKSSRLSSALPAATEPRLQPDLDGVDLTLSRSLVGFAQLIGVELMPWQVRAAEVLTARADGRWRFGEVATVAARQNGKSSLIAPRIVLGLARGEKIAHAAQSRELPRETFVEVAGHFARVPALRRMLSAPPRLSNGQEDIKTLTGGRYRIAASRTEGIRGWDNDLVIIDEVREQRTADFLAGSLGTLTASRDPLVWYLSNAGDDGSVVLNGLRARAGTDDGLGYVEWSASPDRPTEDRDGWREANPALGHTIDMSTLERLFIALPRERFETEHLCRWVRSMRPRLVSGVAWARCERAELETVERPVVGIAVDPSGTRVSAVAAWTQTDGTIALTSVGEWVGNPVDVEDVADELRAVRASWVHDPWTDASLARHLRGSTGITGNQAAAAAAYFVRVVDSGRLQHSRAEPVGEDLAWTERRVKGDGTYIAQRGERPVTAALASVRAVWAASAPRPTPGVG